MAPIAHSVAANEAVGIIDDWIDGVVDSRYESSGCESGYRQPADRPGSIRI